jgi:hypothetical protein
MAVTAGSIQVAFPRSLVSGSQVPCLAKSSSSSWVHWQLPNQHTLMTTSLSPLVITFTARARHAVGEADVDLRHNAVIVFQASDPAAKEGARPYLQALLHASGHHAAARCSAVAQYSTRSVAVCLSGRQGAASSSVQLQVTPQITYCCQGLNRLDRS